MVAELKPNQAEQLAFKTIIFTVISAPADQLHYIYMQETISCHETSHSGQFSSASRNNGFLYGRLCSFKTVSII